MTDKEPHKHELAGDIARECSLKGIPMAYAFGRVCAHLTVGQLLEVKAYFAAAPIGEPIGSPGELDRRIAEIRQAKVGARHG